IKYLVSVFINHGLSAILLFTAAQSAMARSDTRNVSHEDTQTQAREIWEKAVTAKGGRDRLRQISSLYVQADQRQGNHHFWCYIFSGYTFDYSYWAARERSDVYVRNASRGITWWQVEGNQAQSIKYDAEDTYLNLLPQLVYLMMTHDLDPVLLRSRTH